MLYHSFFFAAILAAGAKADGGEAFTDVDTSCIEESSALQVKREVESNNIKLIEAQAKQEEEAKKNIEEPQFLPYGVTGGAGPGGGNHGPDEARGPRRCPRG